MKDAGSKRLVGLLFSVSLFFTCLIFVLMQASGVHAEEISGTYLLVKDSDGTKPKKAAVVTITFAGGRTGTVSMRAVQPGQTVTDSGTYSISGDRITIKFKDGVWEAKNGQFGLSNGNLTLPFMAISGSDDAGTSAWTRQDMSSGGGGGGSASDADKQQKDMAENKDSDALPPGFTEIPTSQDKESCVDCKYGRCIKELIAQKKAFIEMYKNIALEFAGLYSNTDERSRLSPAATVNAKDTKEDYASLKLYNDNIKSWRQRVEELSGEVMAKNPVPSCRLTNSSELAISTNQITCHIDNDELNSFRAAVPCREISEIANRHETMHLERCQKRKDGNQLPTPYALSLEEVQTHQMEMAELNKLLADIKQTPNGCWRCGKTQEIFFDTVDCNVNCPKVSLGGNLVYKCFKLNKEGKHIMQPGNQF